MKTFQHQVLIAHAKGEESLPEAEQLAEAIQAAGYEIAHRGTVMVGESFTEETSKVLNGGGPVVLCGTSRAAGQKWTRQLVNAARSKSRVFCVQVEEEADLDSLTFDEKIACYWQDPTQATQALVAALKKYYPLEAPDSFIPTSIAAEERYRELALESCDIIDLANLPETDRHIAFRKLVVRQLYVALRVQVEISAETVPEDSALELIEKQRRLKRLSLPKWIQETNEDNIPNCARVPIGERLAKARRLMVLGDPGAGKTTLLRWIATAYLLRLKGDPDWQDLPDIATLPAEDWLPIIIRCRDLDESCLLGALDDCLGFTLRKAEMSEAECEALRELLPQKLNAGEALLLIDGLDEITDPAARARFCRQIEQVCIAYPNAPIIATCRIVGYREMGYRLGRGFEHVTVADFSKDDKNDFARRWCAVTEAQERQVKATEELIQDIHSSDRIERLTGNPNFSPLLSDTAKQRHTAIARMIL
jgi:GTPase SAR1 family protein